MKTNAFGLPRAGDGLAPDAPRGREAQSILFAELLAAWRHDMQTMTDMTARLAGRISNDVLEVRSYVFDADASVERSFHVAAGCVVVDNYSAHDVIVASGGRNGGNVAPPAGLGVTRVKAGTYRPVNLASRVFTIYGTNADEISWQVFTAGGIRPAGFGAL